MDENKAFTMCNNNSNGNNGNDNFPTLEVHEETPDSNQKQNSVICNNIQEENSQPTAFPVNLKEVFELTNPNSDVNQALLRQSNNIETTVENYHLSSLNSSIKYNEEKQILWQSDLNKSLNAENEIRADVTQNCDPFLTKSVPCERLVPITNAPWPHAFRDPDNNQDKLATPNAINLSSNGERRAFKSMAHLSIPSENPGDTLPDQPSWSEPLHQNVIHKRANVIVNDVPFHDFALSRVHPSLEVQDKEKAWPTVTEEPAAKHWYPNTEQSVKYVSSSESKKVPTLNSKKDASCQVDDIPFQSVLGESLVSSEKPTKNGNNDGPLSLTVQNESQNLLQVPALENNVIKPELYTQERNLCVAVGTKTYDKHSRPGMYPCSQCGKAFGDNRSLHRHLIVHSGLRSFHCPECNKAFMLKGDLTRHVRIHSGEKPYACEICHRRFTLKGNLMQHFRTHSPEKQYACTLCSKNYAQKDSLHRHIRAHFGDKPFQCDHCGKRFTLKGDLSRHILIHSGVKPHVCKFCGRNFSLKGNLRQHIRVHTKLKSDFVPTLSKVHNEQRMIHDPLYSNVQKKQLFQSNLSPMFKLPLEISNNVENVSAPVENGHHVSDFDSVSHSEDNHQIQSSELAFCSACSRTFPSPESLQKHVQLIHEQSTRLSNKRYLCNVCKKEFSLKGDITRHLNSHNGIKPYQCEQCEKTFTLKSNLRQHLTTHVLNKNFDCPLCSKPFGNRRNLSLHLKRHDQASANFMCTKCGRSFLAKSDHFFHNCSKDNASDSSNQVPLNCSLNSATMCSSSSSPPPAVTTAHYSIPAEPKTDVSQSSGNTDIYTIKKELFLPLSCNERELNNSNPENLSQSSHTTETFFNPFYRHLYFATSNQTMPSLRGLLHPSTELTADVIKMTKAN